MSRSVRVEFEGASYHVMARGVARKPTFLDDSDRRHFLEVVGKLVRSGVLQVNAFCLMPNHYHLLLSTPRAGLARWMRHVNGDYVRYFNYRHRRVGHLWQGRYKAILVGDAGYPSAFGDRSAARTHQRHRVPRGTSPGAGGGPVSRIRLEAAPVGGAVAAGSQ